MTEEALYFDILEESACLRVLGIDHSVPLTADAMARRLVVTFFPHSRMNERLRRFTGRLQHALARCGVTILEYEDALVGNGSRKLREGIVVIAAGEAETGNLPIDHASNLRTTTFVGIVDGPCPADGVDSMQDKLNAVVRGLSWNIYQVVMYVEDTGWTITTMNGAIIKCSADGGFVTDIAETLVPKLAAPVVPPHSTDFDIREGALDLSSTKYAKYVHDFVEGGPLWAATGLMLYHTSLDSLEFRNRYYKRIAAAYLDHRSGMSYGFLARQLASPVLPAMEDEECDHPGHVTVTLDGARLVVHVPEVQILTTRSGCNKSKIDPHRDLVLLGLSSGTIFMETPKGVSARLDCKPSYDTTTIIAHAVANSLIASVLRKLTPHAAFPRTFQSEGVGLAHWHGDVDPAALPPGYFVHGGNNPPVSCSTHQAALYALTGKMQVLKRSLAAQGEFQGDVQIEPHHGTNITGPSLAQLARWALSHSESITGSQANEGKQLAIAGAMG